MPTYTFQVRRTGNVDVACSVPWRLEGTGALPIQGASFAGGVLPSGTASFAAGAVLASPSFELLEGDRPALSRTGQLILRNPVNCKLDPQADRHSLTLQGENVQTPTGLYEPIRLADLPTSRRTNVTTLGTRTGTAGQNFVLTSDVSNATLTLGGTGSAGQEIVFRGDTDSSAATGLRTLTNCTINIEGAFCGLARLVLRNCRVRVNSRDCFVTRCEVTDHTATRAADGSIDVSAGDSAIRFSCHKNDFTDRLGPNIGSVLFGIESLQTVFAYNLVDGHRAHSFGGTGSYIVYYGQSESSTNIQSFLKVHHNLFVDCDVDDLDEIKGSDTDVYENTVERCGNLGFRIRHGMRNKVRRNLFLEAGNGALITVRTGPHEITENQFLTGSGAPGGGSIDLFAGRLHWDYEVWKDQHVPGQANNWQAAGHCLVLGNQAEVVNGVESGTSTSPPEVRHGYLADGNNLGPTSGASRNRAVTQTPWVVNTQRLTVTGYDIDRVLTRMERGAVGLRAP